MNLDLEAALRRHRIIPVVAIDDCDDAVPLAKTLAEGGLPVLEVTFRTAAAEESIRRIATQCPEVLVGAGTVITVDQADAAKAAGAHFAVSPGFNPKVVAHCLEIDLPIIPGVNSPTGVEQGLEFGLKLLKFFPAAASGGLAMISALAGPYPQVAFMPTGGITEQSVGEWLAKPNVAAVGGTWIASRESLFAHDLAGISSRARAAHELASNQQ
ncbi:MAG: bifunctional 4-hydroxy-2-oxoglutarate aldolase/2-dehydro-3-deoxy-phosphogluconate aldolase [Acidimicrobiia bacterium]